MTIEVRGADYVLPAGSVLALSLQPGIRFEQDGHVAGSITIAGTLSIIATPADATIDSGIEAVTAAFFGDTGAARILIAPTGVLKMDAGASLSALAGIDDNGAASFVNQGLIDIKTNANAMGAAIKDVGLPQSITGLNAGTIHVVSLAGAAQGLDIGTKVGGVVNTGTIDVSGFSGFQSAIGLHIFGPPPAENDGQVFAHALGAMPAVGVEFDISGTLNASFTNAGLISSDISLYVSSFPLGFTSATETMTILNSGTMIGEIDLRPSDPANTATLLTNTGTINGAIDFGRANDTYDGRSGHETGLISGGLGDDTLMGGAGFDNLQGNMGNDSLSGGGGGDIVVGGKDDDHQAGDDGNDVVWGNLGNDTLDGGAGADQVRGGQGDDVVNGGAGNDYVSGDRGNDTITGGAGADLFHGSQDAGIDRVLDFNLGEGDRVMLDPGTTYTVSQVGSDTVIDMGAGNQMILVGVQMSTLTSGWIFEG